MQRRTPFTSGYISSQPVAQPVAQPVVQPVQPVAQPVALPEAQPEAEILIYAPELPFPETNFRYGNKII